MQPLGLTGMQWEPVLMLWLKRAGTVAGLARAGGVGFASMSRMLDRLEDKDLLRRVRSARDRRVVHLELEADRAAAVLLAGAGEDLVADAEVRLAPGRRLLGVGERQTDLAHLLQNVLRCVHLRSAQKLNPRR